MQLCVGLLLVASCSPAGTGETDASSTVAELTTSNRFQNHAYPGADLFLPTAVESAPLVVLVPGGAWETGDRSGLIGLSEYLAAGGVAAMTSDLTDGGEGFYYPAPIEEVMCLVGEAVTRMQGLGVVPSSITLLGHSSGAHLAALAALAPDRYQTRCELEGLSIDGVRDDNRIENLELWSSSHPSGRRVDDLLVWAQVMFDRYYEEEWSDESTW